MGQQPAGFLRHRTDPEIGLRGEHAGNREAVANVVHGAAGQRPRRSAVVVSDVGQQNPPRNEPFGLEDVDELAPNVGEAGDLPNFARTR